MKQTLLEGLLNAGDAPAGYYCPLEDVKKLQTSFTKAKKQKRRLEQRIEVLTRERDQLVRELVKEKAST